MSASGTNSGGLYSARQVLEAALRRAGIPPAKYTSEIVEVAYDEFNVMLIEMLNLGTQLWGRDRIILPLYQNVSTVPCPLGTSLVLTVNQRYMNRPPVIAPFSDTGLTSPLAFDDDFATSYVPLAPEGVLGGFFETPTQITTVGILSDSPGEYGIFYEYTLDMGVTWISAYSTQITVAAGPAQWFWQDIEGTPAASGWRIRTVGIYQLSVVELYFGNLPTEIPMGVWSLDDFNAMPVKTMQGAPWNWYQQRDLDVPVLYLWPTPNAQCRYYHLVAWRRRYLDRVTAMTQTLDISPRWNEAITATMARRLCRSLPEADMQRYAMLQGEEAEAMRLAMGEERDPAPMRYNPGLAVYRF